MQGQEKYPPQQGGPPPGQYPPSGQYPPPGQYPPAYGQQGQQVTVVQGQPQTVVLTQTFRETPVRMTCPSCHADIMSAMNYETGMLTWLLFGAMCIFGFWICCFIPFCVDGCKDVVHNCPNCQHTLGVYRRLG